MLRADPQLKFIGPVDSVVPEAVADDLLAVLREGLTNIARHAFADTVLVRLTATTSQVSLEIDDDGVGSAGRAAEAAWPTCATEQNCTAAHSPSPLPPDGRDHRNREPDCIGRCPCHDQVPHSGLHAR